MDLGIARRLEIGAFEGCTALPAIHIPSNFQLVDGIQEDAFKDCLSLRTISSASAYVPVPDGASSAFDGCECPPSDVPVTYCSLVFFVLVAGLSLQ